MAEDQNIEYKESWRDEYLKWICGFANAQRGKIYQKFRVPVAQ
jgi:ATP-dependent DNA helicase RecG